MKYLSLMIPGNNLPCLDKNYIPVYGFIKSYLNDAKKPFAIALERENGFIFRFNTLIHGVPEMSELDLVYIKNLVKFILYARGGWRLFLCGDKDLSEKIKTIFYTESRKKDTISLMEKVYEHDFEFVILSYEECPKENESSIPVGRHLDGCRIGFDAGGSDRKVSAVVDGNSLYSEEVEWTPKLMADPDYHFHGIVEAMKTAASRMPRVDAIGVSSAGIVVNNRIMSAELFRLVPKDLFDEKVKDIYLRAAKEIGNIPIVVANDGDISALAGSMSLEDGCVLGLAMGTSEAVGYINKNGHMTGWLNELAFAPIDLYHSSEEHEFSNNYGEGSSYLSQDAVIRLAPAAGIELDPMLLPAQKLKVVQSLMSIGDQRAHKIFNDIGCYLGHSLALYSIFYEIRHVLLMGRVTSGPGGDIILSTCQKVLEEDYPELKGKFQVLLPDEKNRRVGQSIAAASLPEIIS